MQCNFRLNRTLHYSSIICHSHIVLSKARLPIGNFQFSYNISGMRIKYVLNITFNIRILNFPIVKYMHNPIICEINIPFHVFARLSSFGISIWGENLTIALRTLFGKENIIRDVTKILPQASSFIQLYMSIHVSLYTIIFNNTDSKNWHFVSLNSCRNFSSVQCFIDSIFLILDLNLKLYLKSLRIMIVYPFIFWVGRCIETIIHRTL